jgi:multicomponent Na+:H+ antiporter subunit D
MTLLVVLPVLIPLFTAVFALILRGNRDAQRAVSAVGAGGLLVASIVLLINVRDEGIIAVQMGEWAAPFGITLVADLLSSIMVLLAGIMGFAVGLYSLVSMDPRRESFGYHPLFHILLMGVCGAFLTGDVFNLFVWFEIMLIASFVLLALGGERGQLEGAIKYVTLNLVSSMIFLSAIGILYGLTGTLNMADLSQKLANVDQPGLITTASMLFMVSFGIKAAVFPLFFWLPASYHTPPVAVSAIFAGMLTKVGVYALFRVFTLIFTQDTGYTHTIILVVAGVSMVTGVLGAVAQDEFRRILSFHIVSQIGYMLMGLGLFTTLGLAGGIFYIIHHIVAKTNLFLLSGLANRFRGSYELKKLGGLYHSYPIVAALFMISALALAGIPPFSGFFAKVTLVRAGVELESYLIVAAAALVSVLTLFSMVKIWNEAFWKPQDHEYAVIAPDAAAGGKLPMTTRPMLTLLFPVASLAILSIVIGFGAEFVFQLSYDAAEQLLDPSLYVESVLGGEP